MVKNKLMTLTVAATGGAIGAAVGIPLAIHVLAPVLEDRPEHLWRSLGSVDTFPVGKMSNALLRISDEPQHEALAERSIYVLRKSESEFVVFSRACSDLGCPVVWDAGSEWFFCPCHGGVFDKEGERRAGPPKRGLYKYEFRIENGELEIDALSVPPMA